MKQIVYTAQTGKDNSKIFSAIMGLYLPPPQKILDCTWGKGNFWSGTPKEKYDLYSLDILPVGDIVGDFGGLPFQINSFDGVVFDPPYKMQGGISPTAEGESYKIENDNRRRVYDLYVGGLTEGNRVLKTGGFLVVKCQDQITDKNVQYRQEILVWYIATQLLRLRDVDKFMLIRNRIRPQPHKVQRHGWKNYSTFWVFQKKQKGYENEALPDLWK